MPLTNALSGASLDRAEDGRRRDPEWVETQIADPAGRAVVISDAGIRVKDGALVLLPLADAWPALGTTPLLLGVDAGRPVFAIDAGPPPQTGRPHMVAVSGTSGELPEPGVLTLREAVALLSQEEGGLLAYAAALLNWHRANRFCANCGTLSEIIEGGVTRICPACRVEHHPRMDPVVITIVIDGDRVLLGRQANWPARRYSALAGFVAPGETLEEAIVREVREETGVAVADPGYLGSQPWPFPSSLMLGFTAQYVGGEIRGADTELEDAAWFNRGHVAAAATVDTAWESQADGRVLLLPPRISIARQLIEHWLSMSG